MIDRKFLNVSGIFLFAFGGLVLSYEAQASEGYLEPGTLRLTHTLNLEGVFHQLQPGWFVQSGASDKENKLYSQSGSNKRPWKSEWGQNLLTEIEAQVNQDMGARVLFEAQGEYADQFWHPVNIEHHSKLQNNPVFLRQAYGHVTHEDWYAVGFSGVAHDNWEAKGDLFALYPAAYPERDYLGSSGYFGIYPDRWKKDFYLDVSKRHIPQGFE